MNETLPQPQHTEEKPLESKQERIDHINEVISAGIDDFNEKQEYDKKYEEAKRVLEIEKVKNRTQETYSVGTEFAADKKSKQASMLKKMIVWGSMVLGLSSIAKEATANTGGDKQGTKKETVKSVENTQELTDQEKTDWGEYVTYTKDLHLNTDPRMKSRAFAHQVLEDFIKSLNGRPTTLDQEQVLRIQKEFAKMREWTLKKIKNHEKINGHYVEFDDGVTENQFMANLSNPDDIAGPQTLRYFGEDYTQMIKELKFHFKDVEYIASVQKMPLVEGKFVSMKESKEEK